MRVGLIGSGNMARAIARGWGEPVLATDSGSGRAERLVDELGGDVADSNAALAEQADLVVLCHKPAQLEAVAAEIAGKAKAVASVLGGTPLSRVEAVYPNIPVFALMPNTPVEVRRGIVCMAVGQHVDPDLEHRVEALFAQLGQVVRLPGRQLEAATSITGVGPAYVALIVEAITDAGVRRGLPAAQAAELATETLAGTAELLAARDYDTLQVRREVTSPGGSTARGLAALEANGLRTAFQAAADAVIDGGRR